MTTLIEAAQQALEELEIADARDDEKSYQSAITALRQAIEQAEKPEPVALKKGECWPESVMQMWDYYRKEIAAGHTGSEPRDWFESLAEMRLVDTSPPPRQQVQFPTMLRKMWSGSEVQAWLDENVNGIKGEA